MNAEFTPSNRQKARRPKRGLFWCWHCDGHIVGEGGKCRCCGHRSGRRVDKKPAPEA